MGDKILSNILLIFRPLGEGKSLKEKFDAIFAATRYKIYAIIIAFYGFVLLTKTKQITKKKKNT